MTELLDLLDDVMAIATETRIHMHPSGDMPEDHDCDGCGAAMPDVDLWAENQETGEQLWLCLSCGF